MRALIVVAVILAAAGCTGPRHVKLTIEQLHDVERCVVDADDQVERQNCVERLLPREAQ